MLIHFAIAYFYPYKSKSVQTHNFRKQGIYGQGKIGVNAEIFAICILHSTTMI